MRLPTIALLLTLAVTSLAVTSLAEGQSTAPPAEAARRSPLVADLPGVARHLVTVNGAQLQYLDFGGRGEPVVLLAGLGNTAWIWSDFAPQLVREGFRVVALTRRAHGESEAPLGGYSLDTLAMDVVALMDSLRLPRAHLVGHSFAGEELTRLAARHPTRVRRLVYVDAAYDRAAQQRYFSASQPPAPLVARTPADDASIDAYLAFERQARFDLARSWTRGGPAERDYRASLVADSAGRVRWRTPLARYGQMIQGVSGAAPQYAGVRAPALALYATAGYVLPASATPEQRAEYTRFEERSLRPWTAESMRQFRAGVRGARVVEMNGVHHLFLDRPDETLHHVASFLRGTPRTAYRPAPAAIFVTWNGDPTTTVSVDWHMRVGTDIPTLEVRGPGMPRWRTVRADSLAFPYSPRGVRRAQVTGLRPDATYELRVGASPVYRYRTMPRRLTRPVRFAAGGDTQADTIQFGPMNRVAAARDVDFVLIGGDLAYSNGDPQWVRREEAWYETVTSTLVTRERRLIPLIAAIGNHEVFSNRDTAAANVRMMRETGVKIGDPSYYGRLHAHAVEHRYRVFDVGDYLSVVLLNTGHTAPVGGAQRDWLAGVLAARTQVPHLFPIYHVPAYPSVRSFEGPTSRLVREHWAPLFERFAVPVAFENHDHAYKRTFPMRAGQRDSTGVVYIGDGAWGAPPRRVGLEHTTPVTYLAKSASVKHGIIVTLDARGARFQAVDTAGEEIDAYTVRVRQRPGH